MLKVGGMCLNVQSCRGVNCVREIALFADKM